MKQFITYSILAILLPFYALGAEGKLSLTVDKNPVMAGERFTLTITLENEKGDIKPPSFIGFQVLFGPSTSTSMQIINGNMTSSKSLSYVMVAPKEGSIQIEPAQAETRSGILTSNSIILNVVSATAGSTPQQGGSQGQINRSAPQAAGANLMLGLNPSRKKIYMGEPIFLEYKLYSKYQGLELVENEFPAHTGFIAFEIENENTGWDPNTEIINGQRYKSATLKKQLLFPTRSGEIELKPFEIAIRANRSFFSAGIEDRAKSRGASITVQPLPPNAPSGFNGAVGELEYAVIADKLTVKTNEPITVTVRISGKGNFRSIDAPKINFPADFEVYDPKITDKTRISASGISGSKEFEFLLIPRYAGEYNVGNLKFSYFNPKTERYVSKSAPDFVFTIEKGTDDNLVSGFSAVARRDITLVNNDIRYIATETRFTKKGQSLFGSTVYIAGLVGIPFLSLIFLLGFRKISALGQDTAENRSRKAKAMAVKRLALAEKELKSGNKNQFYTELINALYGYFSNRFNIPVSELNRENIVANLQNNKISEEKIKETNEILDACEMAKFSPVAITENEKMYQKSLQHIINLEDAL
ncbi:MAG: BatD family protein [Luteibaculaceae bacterium]